MVSVSDGLVASVPGCSALSLDIDGLWREVEDVIAEGAESEPG